MLVACSECHRQYDVGDLAPGSHVRCLCTRRIEVPAAKARQARMQHCSTCGGKLAENAKRCEYCDAAVSLADRGLGDACPECFARLPQGARYCSSCGVEIRPEAVLKHVSDQDCPRCEGTLAICEVEGQGRFTECTSCGGLWLDEVVFEELTRTRDRSSFAYLFTRDEPSPQERPPEKVRYLPCPVCGELMNRRNFASRSGVILDWCRGHGLWFDANELERVLAFVEGGGLERQRDATLERMREDRERERRRRIALERNARVPLQPTPRPDVFSALEAFLNALF